MVKSAAAEALKPRHGNQFAKSAYKVQREKMRSVLKHMPDITHGHVQTCGWIKSSFFLGGVYAVKASSHLTFGICTWSSIKLYMLSISDHEANTGYLKKWPFRGKTECRASERESEREREMYTGVHLAYGCSERQGSLTESLVCQINSVTFKVMLSTHYSTGQLKEEEEQGTGRMEAVNARTRVNHMGIKISILLIFCAS